MTARTTGALTIPRLYCGTVLRSEEDACQVLVGGRVASVRYAPQFPVPRRERVLPGHLVAVAEAAGASAVVVWRWYDAVVLSGDADSVRLWEPAHGEVAAHAQDAAQLSQLAAVIGGVLAPGGLKQVAQHPTTDAQYLPFRP